MFDRPVAKAANEEITLKLRDRSLANAEATLILKALEETNWNLKRTAGKLEIARGTLYSKIRKHNIKRPQ